MKPTAINNIKNESASAYWLIGFAVLTLVIWNIPYGVYILYPFTILGTWFHEMAHGLTALALGGTFHKLVMYPDGSGAAYFSGDLLFGSFGKALTAGAGPIGPTIAGTLFIMTSMKDKSARLVLGFIGFMAAVSVLIWIRSWFGAGVISIFALLFLFAAVKGSGFQARTILQFLGVQAIVSVYLSIGYLFSSGAELETGTIKSDTAVMGSILLLPYWFWGAAVLVFSAIMLFISIRYAFSSNKNSNFA